ncbi:eukaryotic translation initiation factor 2-alpha kinase 1-like [Rhizophagus clarus]|uniref:non-specific serine/threonine protein kinase n=1 Tax=Rhizophagus clarus TaxID=94130 RepID=A0A8H3KV92_9GLOM|nr:eukaryotic translation initiation factor 2-alpha kinase 1-like [Rhizophagus clarus]
MTTNIRSIDIKGVVSNKTRIKSKFFASTPSSEESSSNEDTTAFFTTQKKKNDKNINNEELLPLNIKEYPQTPGSLDTFDEVLVFDKDTEFDANNRRPLETVVASSSNPTQVARYNPDYESILESKRRQSRLLLVSLLENFCLLYDTNPERNHKTFYLICKTLSAMGIIEEEYIDEMSTVRSSYQRAFKDLLVQALNSIKQEQSMKESHMIMDSAESTNTNKNIVHEIHFPESLSKRNSHSQMFKNISFEDILDLQNSRYSNDFIELKLLGKGGFANVWQAKNKLDGIEYAIKKVRLQGGRIPEEKEKIFREIKFLARLEHKNVVRYYSSWLEHINNRQRDIEMSVSSHSNSKGSFESSTSSSNNMLEDGSQDDDSDIFRMSFSSDEQRSEDFSGIDFVGDDISAVGGLHSSSQSPSHGRSHGNSFIETSKNSSSNENIAQVNMDRDWVLFIQMQLCHSSLRDYLKRRDANLLATKKDPLNAIDRHASIELFRGIIHGVAYIHSQGLIHRDLKPGNIFMGIVPENGSNNQNSWIAADCSSFAVERLVPKIGDFGLVTAVDGVQNDSPIDDVVNSNLLKFIDGNGRFDVNIQRSSVSSSYNSKSKRTTGVGTITYASPEQLAKPSCPYNEKVDIYSLGIIFFELHFPFSTGHERVRVLKELRNGILPKGFVERFPKEAAFILWMMAEDPDKRPNAKQILDFELLAGPIDGEHAEMQHRLVQSTQRLDMMTKENEMLKNKVAELEEKLKNCECEIR